MASPSSPITTVPPPATIFSNSNDDVETRIIDFSETMDLVPLCRVNKAAQDRLKNDEFFKKRFFKEHPDLVKCPLIFLRVREIYPESEWKMGCVEMNNENFCVSLSSIKGQASSIDISMKSRIEILKTHLAEICGDVLFRRVDPASPIHKAWEAWKDSERASAELFSRKEQLRKELGPTYTEQESHGVLYLLYTDPTIVELVRENDEEITSICFEDKIQQQRVTVQFYKNFLPLYEEILLLDIARYRQRDEIKKKEQKYLELEKQRQKLDDRRKETEAQQEKIEHWLSLTPLEQKNSHEDLFSKIREKLHEQFVIARQVEEENASLPLLNECSTLLQELLGQSPRSQAGLDRLRLLINSCPKRIMTKIWESLYHDCANGASEDQWSEKHFHHCLDTLQYIIEPMKKSILRQQQNFQ